MNLVTIPGLITLNPPASPEAIASVSQRFSASLPEDYAALLAQADGLIADRFILYPCDDLLERNEVFEVGENAPGFVAIGDDNGGRAIVQRGGPGRSPVFLVGQGSMQIADMVQVAECLSEWIDSGCLMGPNS